MGRAQKNDKFNTHFRQTIQKVEREVAVSLSTRKRPAETQPSNKATKLAKVESPLAVGVAIKEEQSGDTPASVPVRCKPLSCFADNAIGQCVLGSKQNEKLTLSLFADGAKIIVNLSESPVSLRHYYFLAMFGKGAFKQIGGSEKTRKKMILMCHHP